MGGTTAYFSGVESGQHWQQCTSVNVENVLMSYWQFYNKTPDIVKTRKLANPKINFMIDSGAHTFIEDYTKFSQWTRSDFERYATGYAKWLDANRQYIQCAVELDIDYCLNMVLAKNQNSTVGVSMVEDWQKRLFAPLEKKGLQIIYVWHVERGVDGWEDLCRSHTYVGLPGEMSKKADFNKFMTVARRYCTKVHGFAATKQMDFRDVPWTSVDSITWKTGEMYGTLIDWDDRAQKLTIIDDKAERPRLRTKLDGLGFNSQAIIADTDYKEVTRYSLFSMRSMEAFYRRRYANRTFYYELRLPPPSVILSGFTAPVAMAWWAKFRPADLFKQHVQSSASDVIKILASLSSVQNGDPSYIKSEPAAVAFLKAYFPALADPLVTDMSIFQKELAAYVSPPNPPAIPRSEVEHYAAENNPPRRRDVQDFNVEDLIYDPAESPVFNLL